MLARYQLTLVYIKRYPKRIRKGKLKRIIEIQIGAVIIPTRVNPINASEIIP